ncbi:hypothetical protein RhiirA4_461329 [Rhizophagus irregularis]|uniref:Uncharacterized protein n=1 Tax=Rhizophagus irregularis TaxID=588596 RepID=A0A2I1GIK5_9GLOM|nr:hypothetical protein RhiirA4_461329 [Rhizophagus irregularis]
MAIFAEKDSKNFCYGGITGDIVDMECTFNLSDTVYFIHSSTTDPPPYNLPQQKIFIAANFYNNESILSNFSEQLLELIQILKQENVYVSIFENGSKDNTKFFLHTLQSTLNNIGVENTVITDDTPKYYTMSDILTLLGTNGYSYDAACAMDFYWTFYDTFATRELPFFSSSSPNISFPWPPTSYYPYFYSTTAQQQIYNGESVQDREIPFEASECCLVYSDFRKFGYDKVFINPNVRVSYVYRFYIWSNYFLSLINRLFFGYFNHPTPPSLFSYAGMRMQELISDAEKFNITELDRICVQ